MRFRRTGYCIALVAVAQILDSAGLGAEVAQIPSHRQFKYESFDAASGALYRSSGGNADYNDTVRDVFVDSRGRVWVGSVNGLGVYDGSGWTTRTFGLPSDGSLAVRAALRLLRITEGGPTRIVEGPAGTIWFGGAMGIWRFRGGKYEEIPSDIEHINAMAADRVGGLWVVDRFATLRYDGQSWSTVLCPYIGKPRSFEAAGFRGIAIETSGVVWIGATAYRAFDEPWSHEGLVWTVDQEAKKRNGGPPMAPLFAFDGRVWRAFGPPQGLTAFYKKAEHRPLGGTPRGWAVPEVAGDGRIVVRTPNGYFSNKGGAWSPTEEVDVQAGTRWVVRRKRHRNSELLFWDGERFIEARPRDHQTGELLNEGGDLWGNWHLGEDPNSGDVWIGTRKGLFRVWPERQGQ